MTAIDMNTGEHLWMTPLGDGDRIRRHRLLRDLNLPPLGGDGRGNPLLTRTLLITALSAGGSGGGARLVAYDKATGAELGSVDLPRGAIGTPMTYMVDGRQYVALTIGGTPPELIAYALPEAEAEMVVSRQQHAVSQGVYTDAQAALGESVFVRECVACHANNPAATAGDGTVPPLIGADFRFRWTGSPIADLFDSISQTMPLAAPASLSASEYAALTAYVLKLNGYPSGAARLDPANHQGLMQIYIDQLAPENH